MQMVYADGIDLCKALMQSAYFYADGVCKALTFMQLLYADGIGLCKWYSPKNDVRAPCCPIVGGPLCCCWSARAGDLRRLCAFWGHVDKSR